jgi:hypothetical protein
MSRKQETFNVSDFEVNCLMLHPVSWPNHGPLIELYLAEEAVGLVKSLEWQLHKGPMWNTSQEEGANEMESDSDGE